MTLPRDELDLMQTVRREPVAAGVVLAGRYQLEQRIGTGGMGQVWRAVDRELDLPVAVKLLPTLLGGDPRSIAALKREAAIALRLSHPHICRLHTLQIDGEATFLVMECVDGITLDAFIARQADGRLTWPRLFPLARQLAEALDYAHGLQLPVLHRDIKPQNILIGDSGRATLLDFGIAREIHDSITRMTGREATSGTVPYMSPEQFRGESMDASSDVYSFAAVLYECLAGRPLVSPHGSLSWQILEKPFTPIEDVPEAVNRRLESALAKDPRLRPKRCMDVVEPTTPIGSATGMDVAEQAHSGDAGLPGWADATGAIGGAEDEQKQQLQRRIERDAAACAEWLTRGGVAQQFVTQATREQLTAWHSGAARRWPAALWLMGLRLASLESGRDRSEAATHFAAAARAGYAPAQYSLGACHAHGDGAPFDAGQAVRWYRAAAEQGFAPAEHELGCCYEHGLGIEPDRREALNWYLRAAQRGYPDAQYALGACYEAQTDRRGPDGQAPSGGAQVTDPAAVEQVMQRAARWYRMAAERGDARAQHRLACCYRDGVGVELNPAVAAQWGRMAAQQGYPPARIWVQDGAPKPPGPAYLDAPWTAPNGRGTKTAHRLVSWWPIIFGGGLGFMIGYIPGMVVGVFVGWLVARSVVR